MVSAMVRLRSAGDRLAGIYGKNLHLLINLQQFGFPQVKLSVDVYDERLEIGKRSWPTRTRPLARHTPVAPPHTISQKGSKRLSASLLCQSCARSPVSKILLHIRRTNGSPRLLSSLVPLLGQAKNTCRRSYLRRSLPESTVHPLTTALKAGSQCEGTRESRGHGGAITA